MTSIDRFHPTTPTSRTAARKPPAEKAAPAQPQDTINVSIDARVRLGKDNKPEVVVEDVEVDGIDVNSQVDRNMEGRRAGLRDQIARKVVGAIADQVAKAIEPVIEKKLEDALTEQHLPASLAHELAETAVPEIAHVVGERLADQAKISYSIGF